MPSNIYYSIDEYYTDDNSIDEHSSHNYEHSLIDEKRKSKCNCCRERRELDHHKSCNRDNSCRDKCNRCGKYHKHSEQKERKCKCDKHSNNKCKKDDDKCIIIKIRPCR